MIDHYKHAKRAAADYAAALRRCQHSDANISIGVTWETERIFTCWDCWQTVKSLGTEYDRAMKAGRRAQLDAMPRCQVETCNRRGTARWGNGPDRALLCGRHGKRANREYVSRFGGTFLMPGPALSLDRIIALATGAA